MRWAAARRAVVLALFLVSVAACEAADPGSGGARGPGDIVPWLPDSGAGAPGVDDTATHPADQAGGTDTGSAPADARADGPPGADETGAPAPDTAPPACPADCDPLAPCAAGVCVTHRIQDLRSPPGPAPAIGETVFVSGVSVTEWREWDDGVHVWVQEPGGGPWSGLEVLLPTADPAVPRLVIGLVVSVRGRWPAALPLVADVFRVEDRPPADLPATPVTLEELDNAAAPWKDVLVRIEQPCVAQTDCTRCCMGSGCCDDCDAVGFDCCPFYESGDFRDARRLALFPSCCEFSGQCETWCSAFEYGWVSGVLWSAGAWRNLLTRRPADIGPRGACCEEKDHCRDWFDPDGDGVGEWDNCPGTYNPGQENADGDGRGDACDPDDDDDGVADATDCAPFDPTSYPGRTERCDFRDDDCDGATDEGYPDSDGDGVADCVDGDRDDDGAQNESDNCPDHANPGQEDGDGDGEGDACDAAP